MTSPHYHQLPSIRHAIGRPAGFKARMFERARLKDNVVQAAGALIDSWARPSPGGPTGADRTGPSRRRRRVAAPPAEVP